MKYAGHLAENGTIGFVAPSFGCNTEPYRTAFGRAQEKFAEMGHGLDLGPNCYAGCGIGISNTPRACGEELTEYYCSAGNDVLISCGGGELMCETMDFVDFEKIRAAAPKWYMGFSDNTNMTFLLTTLCDVASIYGPCASTFGMEPWHESVTDAYRLLRGQIDTVHGYDLWEKEGTRDEEHPTEPYNVTESRVLRAYLPGEGIFSAKPRQEHVIAAKEAGIPSAKARQETDAAGNETEAIDAKRQHEHDAVFQMAKKSASDIADGDLAMPHSEGGQLGGALSIKDNLEIKFSGRLIGGCMDCLVNLLGTRFDRVTDFVERYADDGIVWFLESCDLNVMGMRRAIWEMKNAGWFSYVKGFLIGRPLAYGQDMMGLDQYHAVCDLLADYGVPVVMDLDIGHLPPMMPLVCGSLAGVRVVGNDISIYMREE